MKTTLYSVLCIVVRLLALAHVSAVLFQLKDLFLFPQGVDPALAWAAVVSSAVSVGVGLLLWLKPGILVRPAVSRAAHEVFESALSAEDIQRIGLCMLGVWFAMDGLSDLARPLVRVWLVAANDGWGWDSYAGVFASEAAGQAIPIALGLALVLGSNGIIGVLRRLRGRDDVRLDESAEKPVE